MDVDECARFKIAREPAFTQDAEAVTLDEKMSATPHERAPVELGDALGAEVKPIGDAFEGTGVKPSAALARARAAAITGMKTAAGAPLPLCGSLSDLGAGGLGLELFFRNIRWSGALAAVCALIILLPLMDNLAYNEGASSALLAFAIGPCCRREFDALMLMHVLPFFASSLVALLLVFFIRYKQRTVAAANDVGNVTASDFAVQLGGLPAGHAGEEDLRAFFAQFGKVEHVAVGFKCAK